MTLVTTGENCNLCVVLMRLLTTGDCNLCVVLMTLVTTGDCNLCVVVMNDTCDDWGL